MSDDINVLVSIGKQGGNNLNLTYGMDNSNIIFWTKHMEYIFWIRFQIRVIFMSVKVELLQASRSSAIIGMASLTILAEN